MYNEFQGKGLIKTEIYKNPKEIHSYKSPIDELFYWILKKNKKILTIQFILLHLYYTSCLILL